MTADKIFEEPGGWGILVRKGLTEYGDVVESNVSTSRGELIVMVSVKYVLVQLFPVTRSLMC